MQDCTLVRNERAWKELPRPVGMRALGSQPCFQSWPSKRGLFLFILLLTLGIFHLSLHRHQASVEGMRNGRGGFEPKQAEEGSSWAHAVAPYVLICKTGESFLPPDTFFKRITTEFNGVWKCLRCICGTSPFRATGAFPCPSLPLTGKVKQVTHRDANATGAA